MAELYANDWETVLAAAAGAADTSLTVGGAAPVALQGGQFRAVIDDELVLVTAGQAGTTWTVTRGAEGTVPATHPAGATVAHVLTAGSLALAVGDAVAISDLDPAAALTGAEVVPAVQAGQTVAVDVSQLLGVDLFVGPFDPRVPTSQRAPGANYAHLQAFQVRAPRRVTTATVTMGPTAAGNVDIGIYVGPVNAFTRLASSGSQPVAAPFNPTTVTLSAPVDLVPGVRYWSAIATNSPTCEFYATAPDASGPGLAQVAGRAYSAFPLPATIAAVDPYSYSAAVVFA